MREPPPSKRWKPLNNLASREKISFYRPTWAEIDLRILEQNFLKLKSYLVSSKTEILAVVKADAYGHGAAPIAKHLAALGVRHFGVSSVEEGVALRSAGLDGSLLILGSTYPFGESFEACWRHRLTPTISSLEAARELVRFLSGKNETLPVHIKMETGMQRIGARAETCAQIEKFLRSCPQVRIEGVYTHLASARDEASTREQLSEFERGLALMRAGGGTFIVHAANSAATLRYPQAHYDWVRSGLALYGETPGFEPVTSLKTRIVFLKRVPAGTKISYEGKYVTRRDSLIATLPVGYADGLPIAASGKALVMAAGKKAPVVGLITMDMMMVDVTEAGAVHVGDEVTVVGGEVTPAVWAKWGRTSVYEFLCGLGAPRLAKVYLQ